MKFRIADFLTTLICLAVVLHCSALSTLAQNEYPSRNTSHNQGELQLTFDNRGTIALGKYFLEPFGRGTTVVDPFTRERVTGCIYPRGSAVRFMMQGNLLIGGVVGRDTLVSNSFNEMFADPETTGEFEYISSDQNHLWYSPDAVSSLDITARYTDTLHVSSSPFWSDVRDHIPLGLRITQTSHAWSSPHIDDFVIFDFHLENISGKPIKDAYFGYYVHAAVQAVPIFLDSLTLKEDDITGFLGAYDFDPECEGRDSLWLSYAMDTDGDPDLRTNSWYNSSARSVLGIRVLGFPSPQSGVNYNWFMNGFQPERLATTFDQPRTGATPYTYWRSNDKEAYYYMRRKTIDYDQLYTFINKRSQGWQAPPTNAASIARGGRPFYVYSVGPFNIDVNGTADIALAVVGGTNVHVEPRDFANTFAPSVPQPFYDRLDFSNFATNARWASWVFDSPGVDTDGDGYSGNFHTCEGKRVYYAGDGVRDYKTDGPPVRPVIRVVSDLGRLRVRWNGFLSETTPDPLGGAIDFEGYRVYVARDLQENSFSLVATFDRENFQRFKFGLERGNPVWRPVGFPVTRDSLRIEFADSTFEPNDYTLTSPLQIGSDYIYFAPQDFNAFDLSSPNGIHKVYPDAIDPGNDPSLWSEDDVVYDYDQPLPKFYEYEFVIDSLLASVPYYVSVTCFDHGFPQDGIQPTETRAIDNAIREFAFPNVDAVEDQKLDVFVYPNPYRIDGDYDIHGYENRDNTLTPERARRLNFANLPRVCTISIFSLDGDRIDSFEHNFPEGGPTSQVAEWDLITRNNQSLVSGLYYYVVESPGRTQVGKFMVIK